MSLSENWKTAWASSSFRIHFIISFIFLCGILLILPPYFQFVQSRQGKQLNDFVLNFLSPADFSWWIFGLIYSCAILGMAENIFRPHGLLLAFRAYVFMYVLRITFLYFFPFEPPAGIVLLNDPFLERFFYSNQVITKDLFFSGHTAFIFLLGLLVQNKLLKIFILASSIAVGILLMFQHVHYAVDVLFAPLFAWISYIAAKKIKS